MSDFSTETMDLENGICKILVNGYLDSHTFDKFESSLLDLFDGAHYKIIVDMKNVPSMNSAATGVFIWAHRMATSNGGDIVILNPSRNVLDVFKLIGLDQVFKIAPDLETGILELS